jgi:hypothetical protein
MKIDETRHVSFSDLNRLSITITICSIIWRCHIHYTCSTTSKPLSQSMEYFDRIEKSSDFKKQSIDKTINTSLKRKASDAGLDQSPKNTEPCVICLSPIKERAVAVPCNHCTFDFICLVSWLQESSTCPLCKGEVTKVEYEWASPEDFKTYHVESTLQSTKPHPAVSENLSYEAQRRRHGINRRRSRRQLRADAVTMVSPAEAIQKRKYVYRKRLYSLYVGSNRISRYKDFTPATFAQSEQLQSRAMQWIRRELRVFAFLDSGYDNGIPHRRDGDRHLMTSNFEVVNGNVRARRAANAEFVMNYLIAIMKSVPIKGSEGQAEEMLGDFLGKDNARLFLHELEAFLRSPYEKLEDWDRHVQYADKLIPVTDDC